ncbi:MAG: hypothetical protein R8J84_03395, partial [Mariprofundales bacterium]
PDSAAEFTRQISRLIPQAMKVPSFDASEITEAEVVVETEGVPSIPPVMRIPDFDASEAAMVEPDGGDGEW